MLSQEGRISLKSFTGSAFAFFVICMFNCYYGITNLVANALIVFLYSVNVYFFLRFVYSPYAFAVSFVTVSQCWN